jgi:hypothetical protein
MAIERRDFIKSGFGGMSIGLLVTGLARAQTSPGGSKGVLEGGTGSVHVEGRLKAGVLTLEAQEFTADGDRCVVMNGKLGSIDLYCSFFSYKYEQSIFTVLRSNGHTTSLLLSNSDDPKIAHLVVWNDAEAPAAFKIDKDKFKETLNFKEAILEGRGDSLDLVGKRNPPPFTLNELEAVFRDNEALNEFMRGHRPRHDRAEARVDSFCPMISSIPGSTASLAWHAQRP